MNATKAMTLLAAVAVGLSAQALTLAVKDVKIAQRYPWNGLVDIDYTVECDDPDADVYVYPVGYDVDMNLSVPPRTLTGDGANGKAVKAGTHRMTWDMAKDMGENYNRAKFSMKVHAYAGAAPYMVIDLSAGSNAEKYEVSYMGEIPDGRWSQEYKSTKLVLKLVPPGTFMMGAREDESFRNYDGNNREVRHKVTLKQPFYMGVFELTQQQYKLITGNNPSYYTGDFRPVERVSYSDVRGSTLGAKWPEHQQVDATSFLGKLRSRTGVTFDLPTEAQWEYACRAGTDSSLNSGKDVTGTDSDGKLAEVGRYYNNRSDGKGGYDRHTEVGLYLPNAWGFYDMHGNVYEWCLDWWQDNLSTTPAEDPVGRSSGSRRVVRGGGWYTGGGYAARCRSAYRTDWAASYNINEYDGANHRTDIQGFRVVALPAAK